MPRLFRRLARASSVSALSVVLLLCGIGRASAGQGQDASIIGQVIDESGAVLPGVTVAATSPALQVQTVTALPTNAVNIACRRCRSAPTKSRTRSPDSRRSGSRTSA